VRERAKGKRQKAKVESRRREDRRRGAVSLLRLLPFAFCLLPSALPAYAGGSFSLDDEPTSLPPAAQAVDIDEHLGGQVDRALAFTDDRGVHLTLGQALAGDRPAVIVLAYYHCPMLCGLVLRGLVDGLSKVGLRLGDDYQAITVSYDPRDTPEGARQKRASTLGGLGRSPEAEADDARAWPFLVGEDREIHALADELGIRYAHDARTDQFAHPAAAIVLTPDGRVSRYLYGIDFPPRDLRLALVEAGQGKTGTIVDRVLLTCYRYDPSARRYGPFIFGFMRIGGALILVVVAALLFALFRGERRRRAARDGEGAP
jgi:protein SCO1/2